MICSRIGLPTYERRIPKQPLLKWTTSKDLHQRIIPAPIQDWSWPHKSIEAPTFHKVPWSKTNLYLYKHKYSNTNTEKEIFVKDLRNIGRHVG